MMWRHSSAHSGGPPNPALCSGNRAELHEEGVPCVSLVRAERGEAGDFVFHQRGVHFGQGRLDYGVIGSFEVDQSVGEDVVHGALLFLRTIIRNHSFNSHYLF